MYCRYCGKELPNDAIFCPNCGKKQNENDSVCLKDKFSIISYIKEHRKVFYILLAWFLLHATLYISSKKYAECNYRFYPFNMSFSHVIQGDTYYDIGVEFLGRSLDYYDFTEFFAYVIILPFFIWGIVGIVPYTMPYLKTASKNLKKRYEQWQEKNAKKREEHHESALKYKMPPGLIVVPDPIQIKPMAEKNVYSEQQKAEKNTIDNEKDTDTNTLTKDNKLQDKDTNIEGNIETKKMSLLPRFFGSIIDKILILIFFVVISLIISPFGAPGRFGTYMGLINSSPRNYEYIDNIAMNRYGTYKEGVSQYYQDMEQIENEAPHIGSTLELDMTITFTFILANLIFYILFESILSASPGKRLFRGVIYDSDDEKIGFNKALTRGLCGGAMMAGIYYLLHVQGGVSNAMVVLIFFLILDIPVLIKRKSILDMCTGTIYKQQVKNK